MKKSLLFYFATITILLVAMVGAAQLGDPVDIRDFNVPSDAVIPLPTGASTSAKQDTIAGYVDGLEGFVDGLEGYTDGLEGYVDGLETVMGTTTTDKDSDTDTTANTFMGALKYLLYLALNDGLNVKSQTADAAMDAAATTDPVQTGGIYEASPTEVEDGDVHTLHFTSDGNLKVSHAASDENGADFYSFITTASANLTNVKASAGVLKTLMLVNPHDSKHYFKLYNKASAPDPSACSANSDCGVAYFVIPGNTDELGGGFVVPLPPEGIEFSTGIGYSVTGAACTVLSTCTDETNTEAGISIFMSYQ